MRLLAVVVAALAAGTVTTGPAQLLDDVVPGGFDLADGAVADLTFEEYAPLAPEAVAHVDAASTDVREMRAAVDVWTAGEGDILLREVTMWNSDEAARAFVEQAVVVATTNELDSTDAPFQGGIAFVGADAGLWTRTLTWRQGPYAITVSHYAIEEGTDAPIGDAAAALAEEVESATGHPVAAGGLLRQPATASTSSDGIPIGTALTGLVVIVGAVWLLLKVKGRGAVRSVDTPVGRDEPTEDSVEGSRDRSRPEHEIDEGTPVREP